MTEVEVEFAALERLRGHATTLRSGLSALRDAAPQAAVPMVAFGKIPYVSAELARGHNDQAQAARQLFASAQEAFSRVADGLDACLAGYRQTEQANRDMFRRMGGGR